MLSDRCPVPSVCDVRALWPYGWTDQDETWHAGRHLHRGWPCLSFAEIFGIRKLRVPGLSCGVVCVILSLFCFSRTLTCDRQMTDRQTDRHTTMAHTALAWCCTVKKWTNWKGQGIAKWSGKSQGKWGKVEEKSGEPYSVFAGPWGQTHWIMKWSFSFVCLFL